MPEETQDLSLFPLSAVLFPGMKLPLHIFEQRYRLMIGRCLEEEQDFGVLMARSSPGPGGVTTAYTVGTSARITHVRRLEDGRMNILTTGVERFRVLQLMQAEPYIIGRIEPFPLEGEESPGVRRLAHRTGQRFVRYLRLVNEVLGSTIDLDIAPRDSSSLAYLIAMAMDIALEEKQELLSIPGISALLAREATLLNREEVLLNRMREMQDSNEGYFRALTQYMSLN
jgi:Lon protease-like protein